MTTAVLLPLVPAAPSAATPTLFYTVPGSTTATIFQMLVLNTSLTVATTYTIWRIPSGGSAPTSDTDQLSYVLNIRQPINALERHSIPDRIALATGDKIYIFATLATVTFSGSVLQQS